MQKRTDKNQLEIVQALKKIGAVVVDLSAVGKGVPDLLIGFRSKMFFLEIKTSTGKLNTKQHEFHSMWTGTPIAVVRTVEEAFYAIGINTPNNRCNFCEVLHTEAATQIKIGRIGSIPVYLCDICFNSLEDYFYTEFEKEQQ